MYLMNLPRICASFLFTLLFKSPGQAWWMAVLSSLTRIVLFSLLLRTYIIPWLFARLSRRIRLRSISLRSIRGLYVCSGSGIWRVERLSYAWTRLDGSRHLTIKIEGLTVEYKESASSSVTKGHQRSMTVAALSFARQQFWDTVSGFFIILDPVLRPLVRAGVVYSLRQVIFWIPSLTSAVFFDIYPARVKFTNSPEYELAAARIHLHTALEFNQVEEGKSNDDSPPRHTTPSRSKRSYSMAAWKSRFTRSVRRSLDRALDTREGKFSASFDVDEIICSTTSDVVFFRLPGSISVQTSMTFDPKHRVLKTHTLETDVKVGACYIDVDALRTLYQLMKTSKTSLPAPKPPLLSPRLSFISPRASFFRLSSPLSPKPPRSPSPLLSPSSPFFENLSASLLPRRHKYQPCMKLQATQSKALLSFLNSVRIQISSIALSCRLNDISDQSEETYRMVAENVVVHTRLSDPQNIPLHRAWLGRRHHTEAFDSDVYAVSLAIDELNLTRNSIQDQLRLFSARRLELTILMTQWPSPLLVTSPFIGGDPNAPSLMVNLGVRSVHATEHLDSLVKVVNRMPNYNSQKSPAAPTTTPLPVPRVKFEVHCGPIRGRLLVGQPQNPRAIELRMDGFVAALNSYFTDRHAPSLNTGNFAEFDSLPLRMTFDFSLVWRPTFIRIRSQQAKRSSYVAFTEDPSFISLETMEIRGGGGAFAHIRDDTQNTACVELSTLATDLTISSDALCIELWHPDVVESLVYLQQALPAPVQKASGSHRALHEQLPSGLMATISLSRLVVFVTAPDLNPDDDLELSRGFALRATGMSTQYCALHAGHLYRHREQREHFLNRMKLHLPEERNVPAMSAASSSSAARSLFMNTSFSKILVRSAVSTQYAADDPFIAERDDPTLENRDFLQLQRLTIDACVRTSSAGSLAESCKISLRIPYVQAVFAISHVYSTMLALQLLKSLAATRPHSPITKRASRLRTTRQLPVQFNATIGIMQLHLILRNTKLSSHLDTFSASLVSDGPLSLRWQEIIFFTELSAAVNKWQGRVETRWEEFLCFRNWNVFLSARASMEQSISVKGETARFRIPFGFVLADLILDASVTFKALRHLQCITSKQSYTPMPNPEAEGPKLVPRISLQVAFLCLEAADDPFETKLGRIIRTGPDAAKNRMDREDAFVVKVESILEAEGATVPERDADWEFTSKHSVSVQEARERLDRVHVLDWMMRLERLKDEQAGAQREISKRFRSSFKTRSNAPSLFEISPIGDDPPLIRASLTNLQLSVSGPSFPLNNLPGFLDEQGFLPKDTKYTLLVPMHVNFSLSSLQVTLRDYPLAMVKIPSHLDTTIASLEFQTDLVIAEELGTDLSVDWVDCPIILPDATLPDVASFCISVPKTIMPVKTYANPEIHVTTPDVTTFTWGVSYGPATQDVMRLVETLSSSPRDPSPALGFWDKMRLIFHWSIRASFRGEVRFHMKGLRDPYEIFGPGAGFMFSWRGHTKLLIGRKNEDKELAQVISDSMLIAIPNLKKLPAQSLKPFKKICAKFCSGIRFGLGFSFERTCGCTCMTCHGSPFHRKCRFFQFRPHHDVKLEKKPCVPELNGPEDSYAAFRSDFIHMSISLTSSTRSIGPNAESQSSSLHLTPKSFAFFWAWWSLFDNVLSLPIRHGSYFPSRAMSPKFGRHLATLKYRLVVPKLFLMHGYIDDSRETWVDGVTPWIGVKASVEDFQVDMHQRDQEMIVPGLLPGSTKVIRRKPFYAAEVVMRRLDLRALVAIFSEPLKRAVGVSAPTQRSNYRSRDDLPSVDHSSPWSDKDDFVETDWTSGVEPTLRVLPVASCPRFAYFKKNTALLDDNSQNSKFGDEDTHQCLLGGEPSVPLVQMALASERLEELTVTAAKESSNDDIENCALKMIPLLEKYITHLLDTDAGQANDTNSYHYSMPADSVSPDEWAEFDNVFQIHCPKIFMDSAIRDIMMQYYYCSRSRRGFEYHMATRAVKFIRDQAEAALALATQDDSSTGSPRNHNAAHAAASAIRNILIGNTSKSSTEAGGGTESAEELDPMNGWSKGVSLRKSHCCLLLKPQIVLRNKGAEKEETCVVAAVQAKLQSFAILDDSNADDPVSGKVMTRTYAVLSGMQTFAPTFKAESGDGCVPLEVLIDLRCESEAFERLVPQTDASFQYDKFNRLRLRNNVTSAVARRSTDSSDSVGVANHLHDQTDLVQVHIPRFTVSASDHHFQTISNIITRLLLYSDEAHKIRLDKLETLLFQYDFTDLTSSADVISDLQRQMRKALEVEHMADANPRFGEEEPQLDLMRLRAHMFLLTEELNFLFEAIKLAQDRSDDQADRKSALLLNASSSEISWRMLDEQRDLLAKVAVQDIDYYWLNRQDSSTVNHLTVGNLQAFDGARDATWTEVLSKYDEPANHPLLKRGLFVLANWSVLPPVGGITIYETFELSLHPLRLQIDARVGRRIMEYVYPSRKNRRHAIEDTLSDIPSSDISRPGLSARVSLDSPTRSVSNQTGEPSEANPSGLTPLRRLGASRSFTDLRTSANEDHQATLRPPLQRTRSSEFLKRSQGTPDLPEPRRQKIRSETIFKGNVANRKPGDAAEMKTRSSQKTFVLVRISSLHLLLSIMKEESFVCRDARIRTRDLEYRNQTLSFEELVNQFIPSDMSWKGWVKMAFNQPLVPVLPVARELISKTKWIASKSTAAVTEYNIPPSKSSRPKAISNVEYSSDEEEGRQSLSLDRPQSGARNLSPTPRRWKKASHRKADAARSVVSSTFTAEPESFDDGSDIGVRPRKRMLSLFHRSRSSKRDRSPSSNMNAYERRWSNESTR